MRGKIALILLAAFLSGVAVGIPTLAVAGVGVTGEAVNSIALNVSPTTLDFGKVLVGAASAAKTVTITNQSSQNLFVYLYATTNLPWSTNPSTNTGTFGALAYIEGGSSVGRLLDWTYIPASAPGVKSVSYMPPGTSANMYLKVFPGKDVPVGSFTFTVEVMGSGS